MGLPVVTRENYYDPEINMAYMGSTQFKAFTKCEAATLAELRSEWVALPIRTGEETMKTKLHTLRVVRVQKNSEPPPRVHGRRS